MTTYITFVGFLTIHYVLFLVISFLFQVKKSFCGHSLPLMLSPLTKVCRIAWKLHPFTELTPFRGQISHLRQTLSVAAAPGVDLPPLQLEVVEKAHVWERLTVGPSHRPPS